MKIDDLWVYFAINALCLLVGSFLVSRSKFFREHVAASGGGRFETLDGLRGWLALGVTMTHVAALYFYYTVGEWAAEEQSDFLKMTGDVGVCLFFMITGFLFWGRLLRSKGELDVHAFFISRIRRLLPMYLASVVMVLVLVAVLTQFTLRVDPETLIKQIRAWFSFGFLHAGDINGVDAHKINVVYWTLFFEWLFYLSLPFLAVFIKGGRGLLLLAIVIVFSTRVPITFNFLFGALAAVAIQKRWFGELLAKKWLTPIPVAALVSSFFFSYAYSFAPILLMFIFFLFIVHGNSLYGLLATRGAKLLGAVSYSIYLINNIVVYAFIHSLNSYLPISDMSTGEFVLFASVAVATTVILSAVTFRYIEYPFLSKRAEGRLSTAAGEVFYLDALAKRAHSTIGRISAVLRKPVSAFIQEIQR